MIKAIKKIQQKTRIRAIKNINRASGYNIPLPVPATAVTVNMSGWANSALFMRRNFPEKTGKYPGMKPIEKPDKKAGKLTALQRYVKAGVGPTNRSRKNIARASGFKTFTTLGSV